MIELIKMEKKAIGFRQRNGFDSKEPINYYDLLSKLGVVTLFKPLSDRFSGMAIKADEYRFILVNSDMAIGRQHFTIGHELYHLYEQENFKAEVTPMEAFSKTNKEELNADIFSSFLLLPNDGLLMMIPEEETRKDKITLKTIIEIEQHFQCSRAALLYRLRELNLISSQKSEEYSKEKAKSAAALNYSVKLYLKGNEGKFIGEDYISTADGLYRKDLIKEIDYISLMHDIGINKI